jgi:acyl carrier protein
MLAADVFELPPDDIADEASFYEELGIDSLQRIEFVVRLERQFGVKFTDDEASGLDDLIRTFGVLRTKGIVIEP